MPQTTLTTTILTVVPQAIDWDSIRQQGVFIEYEIPSSETRKWHYLHNWYLRQSRYPYYLHSRARRLYVLYPDAQTVQALTYDKQQWHPKPMLLQEPNQFPQLVKLLLSAFFTQRNVLVSNNDFYLLVTHTTGGLARVLELDFVHQWRDRQLYDFAVRDSATTLHPLRRSADSDAALMSNAYYTIDRRDGLTVLRRLRPDAVARKLADGVYINPRSRNYRTHIPLFDARSEDTLRRCRSYYLHWFLSTLTVYFHEIGLPFHLKELPFQKVSKSSATFTQPQLSLQGTPVALVDDRLRPQVFPQAEPLHFADQLAQRLREVIADHAWTPALIVTDKTALRPNAVVLRLQDNCREDFSPSDSTSGDDAVGVLAGYSDPYQQFQREFGGTISQSLNINSNTRSQSPAAADEEDEEDDAPAEADAGTLKQQSAAEYLSYGLPPNTKQFKIQVLNSLNQLGLKLMVRAPSDACRRFPILERLHDTIFLYQNALVYRDGDALIFMQTLSNDTAARVIQERTGWDIIRDILLPAQQRTAYQKGADSSPELNKLLEQGRFMVSPRAVWQIEDCDERVLYDIPEIRQRLRVRANEHPKHVFYPQYTPEELAIFDRPTLDALTTFLDTSVQETSLSYDQLRQYRKKGLYACLGIVNSSKLQRYLRTKQIFVASVKGADVVPAYTGISYLPDTQQYYVGDKDGMDESHQQERGFVLRRIVVHQSRTEQVALAEQLMSSFFPLLEVNFIRYQRYTVYPFPFKLIEMWNELQAAARHQQP